MVPRREHEVNGKKAGLTFLSGLPRRRLEGFAPNSRTDNLLDSLALHIPARIGGLRSNFRSKNKTLLESVLHNQVTEFGGQV
jgi:hypothetical protein